jgi:hypothetical protein
MRSTRSRRAFVWCCVPYLLLSVFADFVHAHPMLNPGTAAGLVHQLPSAAADRPHRIPDTSCAVCQLQRVRSRVETKTAGTAVALTTPTMVVTFSDAVPESPVPYPSAFRGPPPALVS